MFYWNFDSTKPIKFFSRKTHDNNINAKLNGSKWLCQTYTTYYASPSEFNFSTGYIVDKDYDVASYKNNFVTTIPAGTTLFFDEDSKFPRTKATVGGFKRCIKKEKAKYIVLKDPTTTRLSINSYIILENNSGELYAITEPEFTYYFQDSIPNMEKALKESDGNLSIRGEIYRGKIRGIDTNCNSLLAFNNGDYSVPFITDNDLDAIINNSLPDPTLDELLAIKDMLDSQDQNIVKLAVQMIAGFNITKWPLTFRLILMKAPRWNHPRYGSNSVVVKQLKSALNIHYTERYFGWIIDKIEEQGVTYTKDDYALARDFARNCEDIKYYCEHTYGPIPYKFIPDEFKKSDSD